LRNARKGGRGTITEKEWENFVIEIPNNLVGPRGAENRRNQVSSSYEGDTNRAGAQGSSMGETDGKRDLKSPDSKQSKPPERAINSPKDWGKKRSKDAQQLVRGKIGRLLPVSLKRPLKGEPSGRTLGDKQEKKKPLE